MDELVLAILEHYIHLARLGLGIDVQIDEEIVRIPGLHDFLDADSRILDLYGRIGYVFSMDHDLKLGVLHSHPPAWRVKMLDFNGCRLLSDKGQKDSRN